MFGTVTAPDRNNPDPGQVLLEAGLGADALPFVEKSLKREPENWSHWSNRGVAHRMMGNLEQAAEDLWKAHQMSPESPEPLSNLGLVLDDAGQFEAGNKAFKKAFKLNPSRQIAFHLAQSELRLGRWKETWPLWEFGRFEGSWRPIPGIRPWTGEPLDGKRILILKEGGYGDTFLTLRFMGKLREEGANVTLWTWDTQASLLQNHPFIDAVIPGSKYPDPRDYDFQTPTLSLPAVTKTEPHTVPVYDRYLSVEKNGYLFGHNKKVGICWAAQEASIARKFRSIPYETVLPLKDIPVTWVSLQYNECPDWMAGYKLKTWKDTAELVRELDLVISVDTAVLHLAAAMGKPTWGLVPLCTDWKWGVEGCHSVWYDSLRLFRNKDPLAWNALIEEVSRELETWRSNPTG